LGGHNVNDECRKFFFHYKFDKRKESADDTRYKGNRSLWGTVGTAIKEYGLTYNEVLWEMSYVNLMLIFADAPFYEPEDKLDPKGKPIKTVAEAETPEELLNFLK